MYYVYVIVQDVTHNSYVGFSSDLRKRLKQHNAGVGAKRTRKGEWRVAYYEAFVNESEARTREQRLKQDGRAKHQLFKRIEKSLAGQK